MRSTTTPTVWCANDGQPEVHYQPIVDLPTGTMVGVEALARWRTRDGRLLPPAMFVPAAEQTGAIGWIGQHVRDVAMAQVAEWAAACGLQLSLHVNVSPREVHDDLPAQLQTALHQTGLAPHLLVVELTESGPFVEHLNTARILRRIADPGVRIALDDFGTGWSDVNRLRQAPVHVLKIDRSDIAQVNDHIARFRVQAILVYAHRHELEVVAEGIENADQREWLRAHGCAQGQGFLFGAPVPAAQVPAMIAPTKGQVPTAAVAV